MVFANDAWCSHSVTLGDPPMLHEPRPVSDRQKGIGDAGEGIVVMTWLRTIFVAAAALDRVIASKPDLILWQVGTNVGRPQPRGAGEPDPHWAGTDEGDTRRCSADRPAIR